MVAGLGVPEAGGSLCPSLGVPVSHCGAHHCFPPPPCAHRLHLGPSLPAPLKRAGGGGLPLAVQGAPSLLATVKVFPAPALGEGAPLDPCLCK